MIRRRQFLRLMAGAGGLAAPVCLYTWRCEPHWLEVVEKRLPVANLPATLVGHRLAQITDLHIGPRVDDAFLRRGFDTARAFDPAIVVYTGDFTSFEPDIYRHIGRIFPHLARGRLATVAILGNHDYGPDWDHPEVADRIAGLATANGVRVLRNESTGVAGLRIVGMDDVWAHRFEPGRGLAGLAPNDAALVLTHNPDSVDRTGWGGYSGWILAGHTHGGQCKPPFLPPPLLPVRNRRYRAGEYDLGDGRRLYINRGLGHLIRARFNVRPEITMFTLEAA
jgi:predicted MPP superfamily phosphohydrolase